jgi:hypothetical protein
MKRRSTLLYAVLCSLMLGAGASPSVTLAAERPATQLRVTLDRVLGEHAFLIIEVMRTSLTPGPEFDAAGAALDQNTDALVSAIEGIYGKDAASAFGEQWRNHIAFIVDYARALNNQDTSAAQVADSQLQQYVTAFSALLAGAVNLPEDAVAGLIREHVDQLKQVASFKASAFGDAYPDIRETYMHMFMIGDGLATAISTQQPNRFRGREFAFSAATGLRLTLDRLLGEHTELAALAMRARLTDAPDIEASAAALDANTQDLTAAITSIYGEAAGAAFEQKWRQHTELYLQYVAAKKAGDSAAQTVALNGLRDYRTSFTNFLVNANPLLSATRFEELIGEHTSHLVAEADQFAAQDYAAAYGTGREAFTHSGVLSAYLAGAIADQFPSRFPDTATSTPDADLRLIGVLLVMLGAVLLAFGRLTSTRNSGAVGG